MATFMPLKDVTVSRLSMANTAHNTTFKPSKPMQQHIIQPTFYDYVAPVQTVVRVRRNDPYNWSWRVVPLPQPQQQPLQATVQVVPLVQPADIPTESCSCTVLIQFKCHHGEFSSEIALRKGQYVVVQGDRGVDIGVVIRINVADAKQYVERTGPTGEVLRFATQREVDYWASDLKSDESAALEYCRQRVLKHRLPMDVRHAEYQFDKKKLTFYYEAKARVDFVTLLKELFREFSCRIWMEKVRMHE